MSLGNVMLDDLDKELEKRGHDVVRYADDVTVYVTARMSGGVRGAGSTPAPTRFLKTLSSRVFREGSPPGPLL